MYLLFDIGGTKSRFALTQDGKKFTKPEIIETPEDFDEAISLFSKVASEMLERMELSAAVGGLSGTMDREKKTLVRSPHLPLWKDKPFKSELEKSLSCQVFAENDASIVGLGEAVFGAGRDFSSVVYVTVSTGVGGALIVDGKISPNTYGFEPGHQIIDLSLRKNNESPGTLEDLISGTAMEKRFAKKPYEILEDDLWQNELPFILACGLNNMILHWSPEVLVLGGSMIVGSPAISVEETEKHLKSVLVAFPEQPQILKAELEQVGGIYGAMAYLRELGIRQ